MNDWDDAEAFRVYPAVKQLSLDIATETFMAAAMGPEAQRVNDAFVAAVGAGTAILRFPIPGGRWAAGLRARQVLEDFFRQSLPAKRRGDGGDLFSALS